MISGQKWIDLDSKQHGDSNPGPSAFDFSIFSVSGSDERHIEECACTSTTSGCLYGSQDLALSATPVSLLLCVR